MQSEIAKDRKGLRPATGTSDDRPTQRDPRHKEQPTKRRPRSIAQREGRFCVQIVAWTIIRSFFWRYLLAADKSYMTFVIISALRASLSFDADSLAYFRELFRGSISRKPLFFNENKKKT